VAALPISSHSISKGGRGKKRKGDRKKKGHKAHAALFLSFLRLRGKGREGDKRKKGKGEKLRPTLLLPFPSSGNEGEKKGK